MAILNRILRCMLMTLLSFILLYNASSEQVSAVDDIKPSKTRLKLLFSIVLGSSATTLDCTATNITDKPVEVPELGFDSNRIRITTPSGRQLVDTECMEKYPVRVIVAKDTVTWRVDIESIMKTYKQNDMGVYHIIWEIDGDISNELLVRKDAVIAK